ncbi:2Fe-2S iron-sulfur cluster-binding protein [Paraburkholderia antibiotica]|uniref:(2Fe-2S)-binding protein n=1 Tax=Paraburkholderia antibiotica TaxID=2728839 RepID=A0A7X9X7R6_9BURK|nr:2Fe-2S iron-sulfur cluster-binding protein [Paraburkholderia antibiotica]NML33058.1 (2Fe-2S)-binding protein [Paraburkholderia antibiotica]
MHKLTLLPQNLEVLLPTNSPLTELEFELHGQESIPFGCRSGACGACVIEVLSGTDALGTRHEPEATFLQKLGFAGEQFRLACQCRLAGDVTVSAAAGN